MNAVPNQEMMQPEPLEENGSSLPISIPKVPGPTIQSRPNLQTAAKPRTRNQPQTKRSQCLQARQQSSQNMPKSSTRVKEKVVKLPLDLTSRLTPLDLDSALQILQATGLHINEQVERMINEAIKQDQATDTIDQIEPSILLHDLVPPLAISGIDLLL